MPETYKLADGTAVPGLNAAVDMVESGQIDTINQNIADLNTAVADLLIHKVKTAKGNPLDNISVDFGPYHLVVTRPSGGLGTVQLEAIQQTGSLPTDVVYVSNWGDSSTTVRNTWGWDLVSRGALGDGNIENLGGYGGANVATIRIYDINASKFYFVDLRISSTNGTADDCIIYVRE